MTRMTPGAGHVTTGTSPSRIIPPVGSPDKPDSSAGRPARVERRETPLRRLQPARELALEPLDARARPQQLVRDVGLARTVMPVCGEPGGLHCNAALRTCAIAIHRAHYRQIGMPRQAPRRLRTHERSERSYHRVSVLADRAGLRRAARSPRAPSRRLPDRPWRRGNGHRLRNRADDSRGGARCGAGSSCRRRRIRADARARPAGDGGRTTRQRPLRAGRRTGASLGARATGETARAVERLRETLAAHYSEDRGEVLDSRAWLSTARRRRDNV
jgi:hypothetical protein